MSGLLAVSGSAIMYGFGLLFHWRGIAVSGAVVCIVYVLLLFALPESPRWLVAHGKTAEAQRIPTQGSLELPQSGNGLVCAGSHHANGEPLTGAEAITQLGLQRLALLCTEFWSCAQPAEVVEGHGLSLLTNTVAW